MNNYIIKNYENENINLEVKIDLERNTIWLTQNDLAKLFNKTIDELIEECFRLYVERKLYGDEKYGKSRT